MVGDLRDNLVVRVLKAERAGAEGGPRARAISIVGVVALWDEKSKRIVTCQGEMDASDGCVEAKEEGGSTSSRGPGRIWDGIRAMAGGAAGNRDMKKCIRIRGGWQPRRWRRLECRA